MIKINLCPCRSVLHTDIFFRGVLLSSGHVDFYANGGYLQNGCRAGHVCSHLRAPEYFAESIISDVGFWSYECDSWFSYALSLCVGNENLTKTLMGFGVDTK